MADTYAKILIHCVFSTKNRAPQITKPENLWPYLRGIARNRGADTLAVGGTQNHVHMLLALPTGLTISNLIRDLKANSSRHLNEKHRGFAWQDGYAAISVSPSQIGIVRKYIETQDQHHANSSFEREYNAILDKSGVQHSPEYTFG
jgi:putative transposase